MLGIEGILGTGIFVLTEYAGSALVISFILLGLVCVFATLRYSEFASISPVFGSVYK
jgi:basic amino acid/polyamine antiporter, APA family